MRRVYLEETVLWAHPTQQWEKAVTSLQPWLWVGSWETTHIVQNVTFSVGEYSGLGADSCLADLGVEK